jgi:hypothetical protein
LTNHLDDTVDLFYKLSLLCIYFEINKFSLFFKRNEKEPYVLLEIVPFTSFFEPMQISEVVSLFSEKLAAN